ncbi:hypothetical protein DMB84_018510 [Pectobacterium aquaticum]|uniref:Fatty acid hydroxylase domain-containing protein n=1 Tax=Pectobacterium aquaticum TaxID=2204145 RepID=A0AA93DKM3_9GAMM|nr:hypothetical protein F164LOC_05200 [Pectobacterium carotovorum]RRN98988.1 hypothetical protein DMB83_018865 [Pectobacterium aquaticum]RRO00405.1 hypothetical protein DMB79_001035 [Pectobacterium aquaticum]RRO08474.1 hypothetical protein DMB85_010870 [Pectobacterium aquaticum]RRO13394.1 hypothetical protein DMB84_018510 [Pectobacterium aquaticum]
MRDFPSVPFICSALGWHHTFGMLWAVHVVHHSGEHFNLWGRIGQRGRFIRHRTMVYLLIS